MASSHPPHRSFPARPNPGQEPSPTDSASELELGFAGLERAVIMQLKAEQAELTWSAAGSVTADRVTLQKTTAGTVIAKSAAVDRSRVGILVSPVVRGDVHTWLDLRTAVAIGVGIYAGKLVSDIILGFLRR